MHQDNGDQAFIKYRGNIVEEDETGSLLIWYNSLNGDKKDWEVAEVIYLGGYPWGPMMYWSLSISMLSSSAMNILKCHSRISLETLKRVVESALENNYIMAW